MHVFELPLSRRLWDHGFTIVTISCIAMYWILLTCIGKTGPVCKVFSATGTADQPPKGLQWKSRLGQFRRPLDPPASVPDSEHPGVIEIPLLLRCVEGKVRLEETDREKEWL